VDESNGVVNQILFNESRQKLLDTNKKFSPDSAASRRSFIRKAHGSS